MERECVLLDVFTDKPYSGNQLAVFPQAEGLTDEQMQKLAKEINYSETTFLLNVARQEADFKVRIFTPRFEIPFAGHPVLGTSYALMNILNVWPQKKAVLYLKTNVGVIPLEKKAENIWMTQNEPEFSKKYIDKKEVAAMVNLSPEDIADDLPIEEVSTGNKVLILPVKGLASMQRASGNVNNLSRFYKETGSLAPYLFTLETINKEAKIHSRFFAPHAGIIEDPATGSAAGPLTAYLLKYSVFGNNFTIQNEQGIEMGRPSKILMSGKKNRGKYTVRIGGTCAYVGKGKYVV
jgi:trans-2,3-dihydro-3-hydroxyanthranilate isomerase